MFTLALVGKEPPNPGHSAEPHSAGQADDEPEYEAVKEHLKALVDHRADLTATMSSAPAKNAS
jgi:hypothetical protein